MQECLYSFRGREKCAACFGRCKLFAPSFCVNGPPLSVGTAAGFAYLRRCRNILQVMPKKMIDLIGHIQQEANAAVR